MEDFDTTVTVNDAERSVPVLGEYDVEMFVRIPTYEPDGGATGDPEPAVQVVGRVADAEGVDPLTLNRLNDVVDPDALNELVSQGPGAVQIEFEYEGWRVIVCGDGRIRVH